jgi:predicted permease
MEQVLLLLLFGMVGFVLTKTGLIDSKHTKLLSTLAVYVFLSSNVFRTFATNFTVSYLKEKYTLVLVSAVFLLVMVVVSYFVAKWLTKDSYKQNVIRYDLTIPNYSYVGYAMAEGIYGSLMLQNVMMVTVPTSMYTYTMGYCMLTHSKVSFKKLLNPVTIAMVAGAVVGLTGIPLPNVVNLFLSKSSACMAPTGMILAGAVVAEYKFGEMLRRKEVYVITALRLLIIPLAIGGILRLLGMEMQLLPMLLVLSMPCGFNPIIFPKLIGEDCKTGASLALVTNVLCCATIPLVFWIFGVHA